MSRAAEDKLPIQMAIIDLEIPNMDAIALGRAIKGDPWIQDTYCILMINPTISGHGKKAREAGFDAYLTKPVNANTLKQKVDRWMRKVHPEPRPQASEEMSETSISRIAAKST